MSAGKVALLLLLWCGEVVRGQLAGTEVTTRTLNSVDIEICADNVPSTDQASLQSTVQTQLQAMLLTTAVYTTRLYTTAAKGTVCYMYVYQARNPDEVRAAIQTLLGDTSTIAVTYRNSILTCPIAAVPWVGEDIGPLGLDWTLTAGQVLLWGGCGGGLLAMCAVSACCFLYLSGAREARRANLLLAKDRRLFKRLFNHNNTQQPPAEIYYDDENVVSDEDDNNEKKEAAPATVSPKDKSSSTQKKAKKQQGKNGK